MVQRCAVLIDNDRNTLIAGDDPLNGIGVLDGLYLCDGFQFRKTCAYSALRTPAMVLSAEIFAVRFTRFTDGSPLLKKE